MGNTASRSFRLSYLQPWSTFDLRKNCQMSSDGSVWVCWATRLCSKATVVGSIFHCDERLPTAAEFLSLYALSSWKQTDFLWKKWFGKDAETSLQRFFGSDKNNTQRSFGPLWTASETETNRNERRHLSKKLLMFFVNSWGNVCC